MEAIHKGGYAGLMSFDLKDTRRAVYDSTVNTQYTLTHASLDAALKALFHPVFILGFGALVCGIFVVVSIILLHHWRTHGVEKRVTQRAAAIYFSGGFLFLALLTFAAIRALGALATHSQ